MAIGILFFIIRDKTSTVPEDLWFITQEGEEFTFGNADKKLKLVEFFYGNCPDICPTTTLKMNQLKKDLQKEGVFGDKVQFISITIDPYDDTPEVLKNYMHNFEIKDDGNWIFLTGDKERIHDSQKNLRDLAETFKFQYRDPGNGYYVHTSLSYLIDENNRFVKKFPMGEDFDKEKVFETIMDRID